MLNKLKLQKLFFIIVFIEMTFMVIIGYLLQANIKLHEQQGESEKNLSHMDHAARQLKQSSDDLTRFARTYVVTGDEIYRENFYKVLDIRNGKSPRPEKYATVYWDYLPALRSKLHPDKEPKSLLSIFDELPFTEEERQKLNEAFENSNELTELEREAFGAMRGYYRNKYGEFTIEGEANQELAINLLHSRAYHLAKQNIMQPIDEFIQMSNERNVYTVENFKKRFKKNARIFGIVLSIFILTNIIILLLLHERAIKVISYISTELNNSKYEDKSNLQLLNKYDDELGSLISEFNTMRSTLFKKGEVLSKVNTKLIDQYALLNKYLLMTETDLKGQITYASEAFCALSGYKKEEIIGNTYEILVKKENIEEIYNIRNQILHKNHFEGEYENIRKNGEHYWVHVEIDSISDNLGEKIGYRSIYSDISNQKKFAELSTIDNLTGLANKAKTEKELIKELKRVKRYKRTMLIIKFEINKVKHLKNKKLMQDFSQIINSNIRSIDTFGRWQKNEFLIICPETDYDAGLRLIDRINNIIEDDIEELNNNNVSFGLAEYQDGDSKEILVIKADRNLHKVKNKEDNIKKSL